MLVAWRRLDRGFQGVVARRGRGDGAAMASIRTAAASRRDGDVVVAQKGPTKFRGRQQDMDVAVVRQWPTEAAGYGTAWRGRGGGVSSHKLDMHLIM